MIELCDWLPATSACVVLTTTNSFKLSASQYTLASKFASPCVILTGFCLIRKRRTCGVPGVVTLEHVFPIALGACSICREPVADMSTSALLASVIPRETGGPCSIQCKGERHQISSRSSVHPITHFHSSKCVSTVFTIIVSSGR